MWVGNYTLRHQGAAWDQVLLKTTLQGQADSERLSAKLQASLANHGTKMGMGSPLDHLLMQFKPKSIFIFSKAEIQKFFHA